MIPPIEYRGLIAPAMSEQEWRLIMASVLEWATRERPISLVTQAIEIARTGGTVESVVGGLKAAILADSLPRIEALVSANHTNSTPAKQEAWAIYRDGLKAVVPLYRAWDMLEPITEWSVYTFLHNMQYLKSREEVKREIERMV